MKYSDVFSETINESRVMDTEPMKIELREDITVIPIYVANPRQIPLHWRSQAKDLLNTMVEAGILRPISTSRQCVLWFVGYRKEQTILSVSA